MQMMMAKQLKQETDSLMRVVATNKYSQMTLKYLVKVRLLNCIVQEALSLVLMRLMATQINHES